MQECESEREAVKHSEVFEPPSPDRCLFQLAFSSKKNMVAFPALTSAEGLKALDAHLSTRSYIEG